MQARLLIQRGLWDRISVIHITYDLAFDKKEHSFFIVLKSQIII